MYLKQHITDTEEKAAVYKITLRHFSLKKETFSLLSANFKMFLSKKKLLPVSLIFYFFFQTKQEEDFSRSFVNYRENLPDAQRQWAIFFFTSLPPFPILCFSVKNVNLVFFSVMLEVVFVFSLPSFWMPSRGELAIYLMICIMKFVSCKSTDASFVLSYKYLSNPRFATGKYLHSKFVFSSMIFSTVVACIVVAAGTCRKD